MTRPPPKSHLIITRVAMQTRKLNNSQQSSCDLRSCCQMNKCKSKRIRRKCQIKTSNQLTAFCLFGFWLLILLVLLPATSGDSANEQSLDSDQLVASNINRLAGKSITSGGHFCQAQTVGRKAQEQQGSVDHSDTKKVFCFYDIQDDFRPQDLNPCLCTHVVYSYVAVRKNLSFIAGKKGDLRSLASLKRKNPNLKLLVSLRPDDYFSFEAPVVSSNEKNSGSATSPDEQIASSSSSQMNEMHQKFAKRIRDFIVRHSLDGINLDWPYFAQTMPSVNASREHLSLALAAINENLQSSLTQSSPSSAYLRLQSPLVTLTASKDFYAIIDGYNFHEISRLLDFVHLPAFDFDLNVDQYSIGHPARLHGISDAENLDTLVDLFLSSGLPSEQLIAGIPAHGVQITSKPTALDQSHPVSSSSGNNNSSRTDVALDEQLEAAANISIISHAEVCRIRDLARTNCSLSDAAQATSGISNNSSSTCWTMSRSRDLTAPFAYDSEHWVGFDDETSVKLKAKYVLLRKLAGVAMFTANNDDPAGLCGFGPYPLLATINGIFSRAPANVQQGSTISNQAVGSQATTGNQSVGQRGATQFTRAPHQALTATSLMSQIFGKKLTAASTSHSTTPSPSGDLFASASEGREQTVSFNSMAGTSLMSFADIIEKYGAVQRLDGSAALDGSDNQLPCDRVGYQRYPRDCSRFYRCVQTPPATPPSAPTASNSAIAGESGKVATTSISRLQYECPSGLVFDEQYQICNWPSWSAQCTGSGELNSITNSKFSCPNYGYFQNQENCEYFYYCSDYNRGQARAYQFRCPFELGFDEERLQCNWKWLVRGCNVNSTQTSTPATQESSQAMEMARKYLAGNTDEKLASSSTNQAYKRAKRSTFPEPRASGLSNRLTSLLVSLDAFREQRMKKQASGISTPDSLGAPSRPVTGEESIKQGSVHKPKTFRARRRQATISTDAPSSSLPYKRPPPPPSIFPFLPTSALYMIADSFRSYGEAIQAEFNRFLRLAGDRMRNIFGNRGSSSSGSSVKPATNRRTTDESDLHRRQKRTKRETTNGFSENGDLQALESSPSVWSQGVAIQPPPNNHHAQEKVYLVQQSHNIYDPLKRPAGYPLNPLDDLAKAAVLGAEPRLYNQPTHLMSNQLSGITQQEYARLMQSARETFQVQMSQNQHRLQQPPVYHQPNVDHMMASGSSNIPVNQQIHLTGTLESHQPQQPVNSPVPFGMPNVNRLIQQQQQQTAVTKPATSDVTEPARKRRTTMAMKLASLAMPKFVTRAPASTQQTSTAQPTPATKQSKAYKSFLPSLTNAVKAPARSFMSKAMDINKAVHDLISTLAPGSNKNAAALEQQEAQKYLPRLPITTPMPTRFNHLLPHNSNQINLIPQAQTQVPISSPASPQQNRSEPLLLTEQEARALSAQLDLLSKEQLEVLSSSLFSQQEKYQKVEPQNQQIPQSQYQHYEQQQQSQPQQFNQQQQQQQQYNQQKEQQAAPNDDYVSKLLKALSRTSHNPEDVKLLEQLASQLNNPQQMSEQLIEVGQPDDLALLEALGLIPPSSQPKPLNFGPVPANNYNNVQHNNLQPNETQKDAPPTTENINQGASSHEQYQTYSSPQVEEHVAPPMRLENYAPNPPINHFEPQNVDQTVSYIPLQQDASASHHQYPEAPKHYETQQHYYQAQPTVYYTTSTTTTTTTTQRPSEIFTQILQEQSVERPLPPVKQTYMELIESNKTTPDGIETSIESRTKSAISSGAGFSINSAVGLGIVPRPFEGSLPRENFTSTSAAKPATTHNSTDSSVKGGWIVSGGSFNGEEKPMTAGDGHIISSSSSRSIIGPNGPKDQEQVNSFSMGKSQMGLATLGGYNFAMQPVTQFEEVVIKKKFKPFPKQVLVPTEYKFEEVSNLVTQAPQLIQQQQQSQVNFSQQNSAGQVQQVKEDVTTTSFGDSTTFNANESDSLTKHELRQSQQLEQQRLNEAKELEQNLQQFLNQQQHQYGSSDQEYSLLQDSGLMNRKNIPNLSSPLPIIPSQALSPEPQANPQSEEALVPSTSLDQPMTLEPGASKRSKSSRSKTKSQQPKPKGKSSSSSSELDIASQNSELTSTTSKDPKKKRVRVEESGSRVESAFSNFMVELKRSRKTNTDQKVVSTSTTTTTTTTSPRPSVSSKADSSVILSAEGSRSDQRKAKRKSRSKKSKNRKNQQMNESRGTTEALTPLESGQFYEHSTISEAQPRRQPTEATIRNTEKSAQSIPKRQQLQNARETNSLPVATREHVAVYGTKSGFMPIIAPNDPNYQIPREPLNTEASSFSTINEQLQPQGVKESFADSSSDNLWKNFVRKLNDQISVVHLGNYSNVNAQLITARLVILPASPNDQLMRNWHHLAASYPELFPSELSKLNVYPIELGQSSIIESYNGGLIDEKQEERRLNMFRGKFEPVSRLIEKRTFKALDEIVQRSSGRLFMMERSDDMSITMIAVLPNKPLIRPINYQHQLPVTRIVSPTSTSTTSTTTTTTTLSPVTTTPINEISSFQTLEPTMQSSIVTSTVTSVSTQPDQNQNTPSTTNPTTTTIITTNEQSEKQLPAQHSRIATFSQAIQESIQDAIKKRLDIMKDQVKQSMTVKTYHDLNQTTTERSEVVSGWSTPAADALARFENGAQDPLDAASSSTEYSLIRLNNNYSNTEPSLVRVSSPGYNSRAIYEVDGAEPKSLYGLEMNSNQADQRVYFSSTTLKPDREEDQASNNSHFSTTTEQLATTATTTITTTTTTSPKASTETISSSSTTKTPARFISIGAHLMSWPSRMPKVVDQAYVNHFYDHIGDPQLANAAAFQLDDPTTGKTIPDETHTDASLNLQPNHQSSGEESLVPESACTRAGLFQHPFACNKFYECFWDKPLNKFTLHMFECPIKLAFDERIVGCAMPIETSLCVNY